MFRYGFYSLIQKLFHRLEILAHQPITRRTHTYESPSASSQQHVYVLIWSKYEEQHIWKALDEQARTCRKRRDRTGQCSFCEEMHKSKLSLSVPSSSSVRLSMCARTIICFLYHLYIPQLQRCSGPVKNATFNSA